ncbi:concanavalin A-like lectin/glucanase domain-containing protein [Syncephalastrum racemosum]|uniref:Concanavalin A-like lectin/glucanase domain-containing protein n=1 Tax=Syncephalastrum racemosum TaxID=13706 RepID=A0A1X2HP79_SYNRA|nr:concanavalin A-like lectin/glucanase domain-containing protein [Syncephalastrum racemosum]
MHMAFHSPISRSSSIPTPVSSPLSRRPFNDLAIPGSPPACPSYLHHTRYADLVSDQYNKRNAASDKAKAAASFTDSLDLRLPSAWNPSDKSRHIEIGRNGLDLTYKGPGKTESHAASVRSNFPMRRQCGIYYFEMQVLSKGEDGFIGIGFCSPENELDRLPGWDQNSWGYHGDDGHSFEGSGTGKTFGPCFTTGDTVGCGINMADNSAFYTKNGTMLGTAFRNISNIPLYPCIGLRTPGEQVTVNFGQAPFVFDIDQYVKDQKTTLWRQIGHRPLGSKKINGENDRMALDQLVLSYLVYQGYTNTAKAVIQNTRYVNGRELALSHENNGDATDPQAEEKDMYERQNIRVAIANGDFDRAIELTLKYFPQATSEGIGRDVLFQLKCHKFVEMMRDYSDHEQHLHSKDNNDDPMSGDSSSDDNDDKLESRPPGGSYTSTSSVTSSPMASEGRLPDTGVKRDTESSDSCHYMDVDDDDENDADSNETTAKMQRIMAYGQRLQNEYRHDDRPMVRDKLLEIFSLLAYPDPYTSPTAHILDVSERHTLASDLNSALLALQNRPSMPPLERVYRQAVVASEELAGVGNGESLLLSVNELCNVENA